MSSDKDVITRLGGVFFDSYFVVDTELRIQSSNPAFAQLLGIRASERRNLPGSHCYDHLKLEICKERCIAREAIARNGPVRMNEITGERADGTELIVELSAVPLRTTAGEIEAVLVTHRDVTDEHRLKNRYLQAEEQHKKERSKLLRIIEERDQALESGRVASPPHK